MQIDRWSPKFYPINSADANTPRKNERVANDYRGLCEWPLMSGVALAVATTIFEACVLQHPDLRGNHVHLLA
ncbi:hypothetical protein BSU04_01685 [Caballeronia sordidicola]|uniref:Uncharacterized protein n=1 Tax=Caballeronia sordidicola TaxID=196367 RepID=A0A226XBI4_CABSO|nr:hypothetical protein BSU04_01685 [Caballeronia sordidicola]